MSTLAKNNGIINREAEKLAARPHFAVLNHRGMYLSGRHKVVQLSESSDPKTHSSDAATASS